MSENMAPSMGRVCVIGGAGFLGSHVADFLSKAGYQVCIFDRMPSPWLRQDQEMVVGNILDEKALDLAIKGAHIVYNFAAIADLNKVMDQPIESVEINILGNARILNACRKYDVMRFMYASTVYVYSREGSFYRCSKQAAELYVEEFQRRYGLNYTILRYGSLYGPRADESNGLYKVIKLGLKTGILRYEGSVNALREYIHVEDAARASVTTLDNQFSNESVILTGHEPMRVLDMLEMIAEIIGLKDAVEFVPQNDAGHYVRTPYAYQPKLGRKLKPAMHVDLGQGLLELISGIQNDIEHDR